MPSTSLPVAVQAAAGRHADERHARAVRAVLGGGQQAHPPPDDGQVAALAVLRSPGRARRCPWAAFLSFSPPTVRRSTDHISSPAALVAQRPEADAAQLLVERELDLGAGRVHVVVPELAPGHAARVAVCHLGRVDRPGGRLDVVVEAPGAGGLDDRVVVVDGHRRRPAGAAAGLRVRLAADRGPRAAVPRQAQDDPTRLDLRQDVRDDVGQVEARSRRPAARWSRCWAALPVRYS